MTVPAGGVTVLRPERPADAAAIHALLARAFDTSAEADLVERLRHDGDLLLATVATDSERMVIGYAAFARLRVEQGKSEFPAVGLAPLAVAEPFRRQGIGADLVCGGLGNLAVRRESLVFVLGNPAYYARFGFAVETAQPFDCVYAGPYFMALRVADGAPRSGKVRYPAAFDALD